MMTFAYRSNSYFFYAYSLPRENKRKVCPLFAFRVELSLWDTAGQEEFDRVSSKHIIQYMSFYNND